MKVIFFSILAGLGFGGSMFLRKLSVKQIGMPAFIFETIAIILFAVITVSLIFPFSINQIFSKPQAIVISLFGGLFLGIGVISFYLAAKYGTVIYPSIISPILGALTASLLAAFILGEKISLVKLVGLITSIIGLTIFIVGK